MKVIDFVKHVGAASDPIPVVVKQGMDVIARDSSMYHYAAHGGIELNAKITFVTVKKDLITIQVK